ncbi:unnamed protein product [Rhizophagus irregularis]|uniref:Uncharacterized protein n=1 Tax=Rhizophagus irregularis TaxID=588596 RepID=A0A916EIW4_9GLOM|nr:unnamed protein product [Rhizophagus irregularis]
MNKCKKYDVSLIKVGKLDEELHFGAFGRFWWKARDNILYPIRLEMKTLVTLNKTHFIITVVKGTSVAAFQPGYICEANGITSSVYNTPSGAINFLYHILGVFTKFVIEIIIEIRDAEAFFLTFEFEQSYSVVQIANKWKNLVDNYKSQLAASEKSGGHPIVIQYKEEIEAILNKDRPTLNPKSCIDSFVPLPRIENFDLAQKDFEDNNKTEITYEFPKIGRKYTNKHEIKKLMLM